MLQRNYLDLKALKYSGQNLCQTFDRYRREETMKIKKKAANEKFTPKNFEVEWAKFMLDIRQVQKGRNYEKIKNANT